MSITAIMGYRYRVPLSASLPLGSHTVEAREGVLIGVETAAGHTGWGDVAPLPGFSAETLAEAIDALRRLAPALVGSTAAEALAQLATGAVPSSVRFGMELALADGQAQATGTTLPAQFGEAPRAVVTYNGLLTGQEAALTRRAAALRAAGYPAVKLKVGRQSVDEDVARVRAVRAALGERILLRLDANRAWSVEQARRFATGIAGVDIEYIEEPLAEPAHLRAWAAATGLPVALDETVQAGADPGDHRYAAAFVLKPTLTGGVQHTLQMGRRVLAQGGQPILSAAFESGVGLRGLVALAAGLGTQGVPVGLDTYHWLQADVLRPRLPLDGPRVAVAPLMAAARRRNPHVVAIDDPVVAHRVAS